MRDWNVVVTTETDGFDDATELLAPLGFVGRTDYYNVLVMRVHDLEAFLDDLDHLYEEEPRAADALARVLPAQRTADFGSPDAFRDETERIARELAPQLAGGSFHVRMHRRGHQGEISTQEEEERIAGAVFEALDERGETAEVTFDDPDTILDVETVGDRVGMAVWTRADLERHPLLQVD